MKLSEALRLADQIELSDLRGGFMERNVSLWYGEKPPCCVIGGANIASGLCRYNIVSNNIINIGRFDVEQIRVWFGKSFCVG